MKLYRNCLYLSSLKIYLRKALAYEPLNISVRLQGRFCLTDKSSVLSEPRHARRIRSNYLDSETSSVSSVYIARGYLRSSVKNGILLIIDRYELSLSHKAAKHPEYGVFLFNIVHSPCSCRRDIMQFLWHMP